MVLRIIDIETTGTDPETDAIIEIASVDVYKSPDGHGVTSAREALVFPGRDIPPASSAVHHLIASDVADAMRIEAVIAEFSGADAYVAHNCAFERAFLDRYFGEEVTWVCTMKCALRVWPDAPGHSNQVLRYWRGHVTPFGWDRAQLAPHRALSDAVVTAAILVDLIKAASWKQLVEWSKEPALYSTLTFGKHRGTKYSEAPPDYLDWLANKSDMDADTKFSAAYWLRKRSEAA